LPLASASTNIMLCAETKRALIRNELTNSSLRKLIVNYFKINFSPYNFSCINPEF
jgi:hypothetical protein